MTDVAVVHLARPGARGEVRRVDSWCTIIRRSGLAATPVPVVRRRFPEPTAIGAVLGGRAVPEVAAWSESRLRKTLEAMTPRVVLVVSLRAYRSSIGRGPWRTVLDLVDPLERSYLDRARLVGPLRAAGYRALARSHRHVAARVRASGMPVVTAGWSDAQDLGLPWVPITIGDGRPARANRSRP